MGWRPSLDSRSSTRHAVAEAEVTGETEMDKLKGTGKLSVGIID